MEQLQYEIIRNNETNVINILRGNPAVLRQLPPEDMVHATFLQFIVDKGMTRAIGTIIDNNWVE